MDVWIHIQRCVYRCMDSYPVECISMYGFISMSVYMDAWIHNHCCVYGCMDSYPAVYIDVWIHIQQCMH